MAKQTARLQQDEQVLRVLGVDMPESTDQSAIAPRVPVRTEVEVFTLEQANDALERLRRGQLRGAAVLRVE